jgi:hypothetical protein
MTTLGHFAKTYRLRARRDRCRESIIPGKLRAKDMPARTEYASHVYDRGGGRFGLLLMFESKRRWGNAKSKLICAGFEIRQDADTEGVALFDPGNVAQARLAFTLARIRPRPELSQEQRRALLSRLANARGLRNGPEKTQVQAKFSTQPEETGQGGRPGLIRWRAPSNPIEVPRSRRFT